MPFVPFDREAEVARKRRKLPHWEQRGCTYFVTFRLADSIPKTKIDLWKAERDSWRSERPEPWTAKDWQEYHERFTARIERWSDRGWGACWLDDPRVRQIVAEAFIFFHGERYDLEQFVIMANHVHLLVRLKENWSLQKVMHSWKSFTAHKVNELQNRSGTLWMDESFDHIVRSSKQLKRFCRYIEENPAKARLRESQYTFWEPK